MKDLSIVIVNYNVCYFLEQTIISVQKAIKSINAEVFVVDNHSVDGSVEMVINKYPWVKLIANQENVGFSRANNQAIRLSDAKYVLLLNPDTVLQEDTLSKCVNYMNSNTQIGGLGVKMIDGKGNFLPESKRGLPTPWVAFYKISGLAKLFPKSPKFGRYHLGFLDKNQTHEVDVLSGAFMMLRNEALQHSGLLDEDYFMYGEDIDLSYKIQKAGYKNIYFSDTQIIHYKGESTKKSSVNYIKVFYGAMIIFAQKHFSSSSAWFFTFMIRMAIYARAGISLASSFLVKFGYTILCSSTAFLGMVFIKDFWQNNFKPDRNIYPTEYITTIIPFYIFTWILCVYYSGGFDKPYKPYRVLRGIAIGTLFISSISNFVDGLRYSKALILIGALWTASVLIFTRYASNWLKFRKLTLYIPTQKRVIIVGNNSESERVAALIRRVHTQADILGFVSTESYKDSREIYLGSLSNINDIMKLYRPDEVIFCSQSISNGEIMEYMAQAAYTEIEFKIVPDNSNFIIGSSSKNTQGELYTLDIHLAILEPQNVRKKRMLDIFVSIFILILSPIAVFLVTNKSHFLNRVLHVLLGNKSFVGFEHTGLTAPTKLKEGILSPITEFQELSLDKDTIQRLNILYAKDYSPQSDLYIIWRNWRKI